jgi:pimeloyl-ACP methyl ester carboxylesterase
VTFKMKLVLLPGLDGTGDLFAPLVAAILSVDYSQLLRRVRVPMLYMLARRDRLISRSAFNRLDRLRPDIQLQQFDAPHFLLQTLPTESAAKILEFFRFVKTGEYQPS